MSQQAQTTETTETKETPAGDSGEAKITTMIAAQNDGTKAPETKTEEKKETVVTPESKVEEKPYVIEIPEKYAAFVDKASLDGFTKLAKEKGLTIEQAKAVAEFDFERGANAVKASEGAVTKQDQVWLDELKKDPEIGGDKLKDTQNAVLRACAKFGDAKTLKELEILGMGNHPGLVRLLAKVGATLAEDKGQLPGAKNGGDEPKRRSIYDPMNS